MATRGLLLLLIWLLAACDFAAKPVPSIAAGGKLVVVTVNGPATWFEDAQGHPAGFENDLVTLFAKDLGVEVEFALADSPARALKALAEKRAHFAAALLPTGLDLAGGLDWGPAYHSTQQQIVWRAADPKPKSLADLSGRRLGVIEDSLADQLLSDVPKRSLAIDRLPAGSAIEDLLERVARSELDAALVDSTRYTVARKHFPQLDVAFNIGKPVAYAWRVGGIDHRLLMDRMKEFFARIAKDGTLARLADRWFAHAARISAIDASTLLERISTVMPKLRPHFLEAEAVTGFDWRLIAAIAYQESHWDALAASATGVRGMMMLTEDTADRVGVKDRLDSRESILGGARYLGLLLDALPARIPEPDRTFLALAAYNLGIGHLEDARILAQRRGPSPDKWQDVKLALGGLADPATYSALRHGFARGYEAMQFVDNVRNYRDILARVEPRDEKLAPRPHLADQISAKGVAAGR